MRTPIALLFCLVLLYPTAASADQIVLKNGDRLTGTIVKWDGASLTMKSEFAGTVTVPLSAIVKIASDQPLHVNLKNGQTVVGAVATDEEDRLDVKTAETGMLSLARGSVAAVRSKEEQVAWERLAHPGLLNLWNGSFDTGLSLTQGNAKTTSVNAAMNLSRTTAKDKISIYGTSLFARNKTDGKLSTTANAKRGGGRYDINMNPRSFAFGLTDLEADHFQKLHLRLTVGTGMGWHAVKSERLVLDIFGGGSLKKEYFTEGLKRNSGEVLAGHELTLKVWGRTSLKEKTVIFPDMSDTGEYRLMFDASIATSINKWIGWQMTVSDRHISNPVLGTRPNDAIITTGIRLTW